MGSPAPALTGRAGYFGQKPLFYVHQGRQLAFASEIKALLAADPSLAVLNPYALDQYLSLRFVQPPDTFFDKITALPPAHFFVWENEQLRIERYWNLDYGPKWTDSEDALIDRVDELLAETVKLHLVSDVPVGAFLSGGLDSTLIAAYAAKELGTELRTFSMGIALPGPERAAGGGGGRGAVRHAASCRRDDAEGGGRFAEARERARRAGGSPCRSACCISPG